VFSDEIHSSLSLTNMTVQNKSNIVLIGMPGSGKSTVGICLAKLTSCDFVDTDLLIQVSQGRSLQNIVDTEGHIALRKIEEDILLKLNCLNHVIATGGSAVYSHTAITHLQLNGFVVFLDAELAALELRVHNFEIRGLAKRSEQSFAELFEERFPLYRKYADITVKCSNLTQEEISERIIKEWRTRKLRLPKG
jgi:shikimate kinase